MIEVKLFDDSMRNDWDELVTASRHGARQHSRAFLDYHGDTFVDRSVMLMDDARPIAVLPAATSREDARQVVSHPGAAYGGLILAPAVPPSRVPEMTNLIVRHFASETFESFVVRPAWPWLTDRQDETFIHELVRAGAVAHPWQLISTVHLGDVPDLSTRRRRMLKRAQSNVSLRSGLEHLVAFWDVLERRLWDSHSASPVHSVNQITDIAQGSPDFVHLVTAWTHQGDVVAGSLMFAEGPYVHLQYMAASDVGRGLGAMDLVILSARAFGERRGARTLSLGSSIEPGDKAVNRGLLDYKSEFGASNLAVPVFRLELT